MGQSGWGQTERERERREGREERKERGGNCITANLIHLGERRVAELVSLSAIVAEPHSVVPVCPMVADEEKPPRLRPLLQLDSNAGPNVKWTQREKWGEVFHGRPRGSKISRSHLPCLKKNGEGSGRPEDWSQLRQLRCS